MESLGNTGVIGRWKPLHLGGERMLEAICKSSEHVTIGIGSTNKYNYRNPFTPDETKEMLDILLSKKFDNYKIVFIPDYGNQEQYADGQRWREEIVKTFGPLDAFITGDPYVKELLEPDYKIIHPSTIIPEPDWVWIKGSQVRLEMAKGNDWQSLVPKCIADYIVEKKLEERFRKEFGLETLAKITYEQIRNENTTTEKYHVNKE